MNGHGASGFLWNMIHFILILFIHNIMQSIDIILVIVDMPTLWLGGQRPPSLSRKYALSQGNCGILAGGVSSRQQVANATWQKQLIFWKVSFHNDKDRNKTEELVYELGMSKCLFNQSLNIYWTFSVSPGFFALFRHVLCLFYHIKMYYWSFKDISANKSLQNTVSNSMRNYYYY